MLRLLCGGGAYRVGHLLADLGLVNSDLVSSWAGGLPLWLPAAQAGRWNISNLNQPNPGPQADAPPCIQRRLLNTGCRVGEAAEG